MKERNKRGDRDCTRVGEEDGSGGESCDSSRQSFFVPNTSLHPVRVVNRVPEKKVAADEGRIERKVGRNTALEEGEWDSYKEASLPHFLFCSLPPSFSPPFYFLSK